MIYTILLALLGGLGFVGRLWWGKRRAEKRAAAEADKRRQAEGRADVAEATIAVTAEVHADQAAGRVDERAVEAKAAEAAAAGDAHPERAAAHERARIAAASVRRKIAPVRKRGRGW